MHLGGCHSRAIDVCAGEEEEGEGKEGFFSSPPPPPRGFINQQRRPSSLSFPFSSAGPATRRKPFFFSVDFPLPPSLLFFCARVRFMLHCCNHGFFGPPPPPRSTSSRGPWGEKGLHCVAHYRPNPLQGKKRSCSTGDTHRESPQRRKKMLVVTVTAVAVCVRNTGGGGGVAKCVWDLLRSTFPSRDLLCATEEGSPASLRWMHFSHFRSASLLLLLPKPHWQRSSLLHRLGFVSIYTYSYRSTPRGKRGGKNMDLVLSTRGKKGPPFCHSLSLFAWRSRGLD